MKRERKRKKKLVSTSIHIGCHCKHLMTDLVDTVSIQTVVDESVGGIAAPVEDEGSPNDVEGSSVEQASSPKELHTSLEDGDTNEELSSASVEVTQAMDTPVAGDAPADSEQTPSAVRLDLRNDKAQGCLGFDGSTDLAATGADISESEVFVIIDVAGDDILTNESLIVVEISGNVPSESVTGNDPEVVGETGNRS